MTVHILMPSIGPGIETARLTRWIVDEGARIAPGDVIAEIETDTATMELEASQSGTLRRRIVPAGPAEIASGTPIADVEPVAAPIEAAAAGTAEPPSSAIVSHPASHQASPAETQATPHVASNATDIPLPERHPVSPAARAMARDADIDLSAITGSGPGGRILKTDVETWIGNLESAPPHQPDTAQFREPVVGAAAVSNDIASPSGLAAKPMDAKAAGQSQTKSSGQSPASASPHLVMVVDCRIDELLRTRDRINLTAPPRDGQPREKTLAAFYIRAAHLALTLLDDPFEPTGTRDATGRCALTYARMTAAGLNKRHFAQADLSDIEVIAAALSAGSPTKSELGLHDAVEKDEHSNPTMTLLDLGTFRIQRAQGMIATNDDVLLAIGASERRPAASGERISIATIVTATLTIDTERIDPAAAAACLEQFRSLLEAPRSLIFDRPSAHESLR